MSNTLPLSLFILLVTFLTACQSEGDLTESMEETFYVRSDGSDMPVFMRGNGLSKTIIVLLHGGPGDTSVDYMVQNFSQQLQEKYAFAFWDQRQQGNSQGHINKKEVNLQKIVEDLHLVIQSLKLRYGTDVRLYLMGHSWGGTVGTAYLQQPSYQEDISGFIEISGGYDFPLINKEVVKMMQTIGQEEIEKGNNLATWQEILDYIKELPAGALSTEQTLQLNSYAGSIERKKLLEDLYYIPSARDFKEGKDKVSNGVSVTMNAVSIFVQQDLIDELLRTSLTDGLSIIEVPTLLIWGKYDFKVPPRLGEIALEKLGSTEKYLKIYDHAGHSSMKYDPDLLVDDVIEFIDK